MDDPSGGISRQLEAGLEHHRAGRLQQAEQIYRQILTAQPNHAQAMHFLGVIAFQVGKLDAAIPLMQQAVNAGAGPEAMNNLGEALRIAGYLPQALQLLQRAVELAPQYPQAHANLAMALAAMGRASDALKSADRAIALNPTIAAAHFARGQALEQTGRLDDAIDSMEQSLRLQPNQPVALTRLGLLLKRRGMIEQAIRTLTQATQIAPQHAEAFAHLGHAHALRGSFDAAISHATRAVELSPRHPQAHLNLAEIDRLAERLSDAEASARKAIELDPKLAGAWGMLGTILDDQLRINESCEAMERAAGLLPNDAGALSSLGRAYSRSGQDEKAVAAIEQALKVNPNHTDAHGNLSLALLAAGDLKRGFEEYEWRWRCSNFTTAPREFDRPLWDRTDPAGRTILVHAEQGFGDVIQFARYLPMLAQRGATVIVECSVLLRDLIERMPGVSRVVPSGMKLPDFDLHLPLLSLPRAFDTTLETIPREIPYLFPDASRVESWKARLDTVAEGAFKVGLMWGGNRKPDPRRSCRLLELAPLIELSRVQFFSLQKDESATEIAQAPADWRLMDLGSELKTFADSAAVMCGLDLMITIDTAAAHLAGAVGAPTWTMLPFLADWRWLREREDSPWYPTMRLFRQPSPDNWLPVVAQIRDELSRRV